MNSLEGKKKLMAYTYGFSQPYMGGIWEASNLWNADFIAAKWDGRITEFEIKVAASDLRGEVAAIRAALMPDCMIQRPMFPYATDEAKDLHPYLGSMSKTVRPDLKPSHTKIAKHHHYLVEHRKADLSYEQSPILFYPNTFYFAVPSELVALALELTKGLPYGVFNLDMLRVEGKARSLRKDPHTVSTWRDLFSRSCTMRSDLQSEVYSARVTVLSRVATHFKIDPDSVEYLRLQELVKDL